MQACLRTDRVLTVGQALTTSRQVVGCHWPSIAASRAGLGGGCRFSSLPRLGPLRSCTDVPRLSPPCSCAAWWPRMCAAATAPLTWPGACWRCGQGASWLSTPGGVALHGGGRQPEGMCWRRREARCRPLASALLPVCSLGPSFCKSFASVDHAMPAVVLPAARAVWGGGSLRPCRIRPHLVAAARGNAAAGAPPLPLLPAHAPPAMPAPPDSLSPAAPAPPALPKVVAP